MAVSNLLPRQENVYAFGRSDCRSRHRASDPVEPDPAREPPRRKQVVEEEPEPQESRAWLPSLVRGDDEGQRMDEGGRRVEESIPFACSRADEAEPVGLQVSKPAMDKPRGLPARAAREVPAIQEAGPQPSSSGISRDAGPDG